MQDLTEGVAEVASRSLEDKNVVIKANDLAKNIVNTVLTGAKSAQIAENQAQVPQTPR